MYALLASKSHLKIRPGGIKAVLNAFTLCSFLCKPLLSSAELVIKLLDLPGLHLMNSNALL